MGNMWHHFALGEGVIGVTSQDFSFSDNRISWTVLRVCINWFLAYSLFLGRVKEGGASSYGIF